MAGKKLGTSAVIKVSTDNITFNAIELVKGLDWGVTNDEVETTDNDSTGAWKEFLMANRSATCSFTAHYDISKTYQKTLMEEIAESDGGDLLYWKYYPVGVTTTERLCTFTAFVSEVKQGAQNGSVVEVAVTLRVSGVVTVGVVP